MLTQDLSTKQLNTVKDNPGNSMQADEAHLLQ